MKRGQGSRVSWSRGGGCERALASISGGTEVTHPMLLLAISRPFCKLGSPEGSNFRLSANAARMACGFPPISITISARPSRRPMIPICKQAISYTPEQVAHHSPVQVDSDQTILSRMRGGTVGSSQIYGDFSTLSTGSLPNSPIRP